jgi:hypothetical protein
MMESGEQQMNFQSQCCMRDGINCVSERSSALLEDTSKTIKAPQFGHVASKMGKREGEITTDLPQVSQRVGQPSGVRDETLIR